MATVDLRLENLLHDVGGRYGVSHFRFWISEDGIGGSRKLLQKGNSNIVGSWYDLGNLSHVQQLSVLSLARIANNDPLIHLWHSSRVSSGVAAGIATSFSVFTTGGVIVRFAA